VQLIQDNSEVVRINSQLIVSNESHSDCFGGQVEELMCSFARSHLAAIQKNGVGLPKCYGWVVHTMCGQYLLHSHVTKGSLLNSFLYVSLTFRVLFAPCLAIPNLLLYSFTECCSQHS